MNILFCGDKGVCDGITLSTLSLCKNTKKELCIYILTASVGKHEAIDEQFANRLENIIKAKNDNHRVCLINISEQFEGYLPTANMGTRFTPLCMLRLFADLVPKIPDKLLYLDTDVLCRAEFCDFYESAISDTEIAGVPDRYGKWFFGNILRHDYLNSGVLLMNMSAIRRSGLFERCRAMCRDKKMFMPDQSALNKLAKKRKVSSCYNAQGKIHKKTVFKHFTTFFKILPYIRPVTIKPWQIELLHNELKIFEFDDILTQFKEQKNEQRNPDFLHN